MPHGTPDWGLVGPKDTLYGLDDLGEHAVRLGSPHLWDRRGDVIYLSTFDDGLEGAHVAHTGPPSDIRLWTEQARQGAYCVRADVANGTVYHASLEWFLPFPVSSGMGIEFSFREISGTGWWYATIDASDQRGWYEGRVRIDPTAGTLEYFDDTGNWAPLTAGAEYRLRIGGWHTLKLVTMFDLGRYNRVIVDDIVYDMGALPLYTAGAAGPKDLHVIVGKQCALLTDTFGYMDSVIVTQNEP